MKEYGKLTGALGAFLIKDLGEDRQIHLMLLMFALGK